MNKREKIYLAIVILLLGVLVVKSFYLDDYKPVTKDEELFKEYAERLIDEKYHGFFNENKLIGIKIVNIKKLENEGVSTIEVQSENDNEYKSVEIEGKYEAKIRKYLFHILPYGQDKILSRK